MKDNVREALEALAEKYETSSVKKARVQRLSPGGWVSDFSYMAERTFAQEIRGILALDPSGKPEEPSCPVKSCDLPVHSYVVVDESGNLQHYTSKGDLRP